MSLSLTNDKLTTLRVAPLTNNPLFCTGTAPLASHSRVLFYQDAESTGAKYVSWSLLLSTARADDGSWLDFSDVSDVQLEMLMKACDEHGTIERTRFLTSFDVYDTTRGNDGSGLLRGHDNATALIASLLLAKLYCGADQMSDEAWMRHPPVHHASQFGKLFHPPDMHICTHLGSALIGFIAIQARHGLLKLPWRYPEKLYLGPHLTPANLCVLFNTHYDVSPCIVQPRLYGKGQLVCPSMASYGARISDSHARNWYHARPITRDGGYYYPLGVISITELSGDWVIVMSL
ncbi:uncharacterized protein LACBIDRAFT_326556 [Laccaria bicolor S238N-H82]|uniref:Predicted protein n=1 Tax=Laccaria bicolor (strain S238N-H82 / ATCC MYA-4686) TaxID=486041 RepID=B0D909_LACBS|nr:uncharacterized protein LACBIDRAFT_326556 [Laccaria bicolor S238N-H82]EDR08928.1 predicted protein [Laccaria bicolor S238N-H82]|eukprot:XP_001880241.1 predicted protein [Laccaria bicolor S238N-H82]